jgi:hypothetical protein
MGGKIHIIGLKCCQSKTVAGEGEDSVVTLPMIGEAAAAVVCLAVMAATQGTISRIHRLVTVRVLGMVVHLKRPAVGTGAQAGNGPRGRVIVLLTARR